MITRGFLSNAGTKNRVVRLKEVAILLYNVLQGVNDSEVGFEDARETVETLVSKLNYKLKYAPRVLESALWSSNLLNERGKFWHPEGKSFDEFVRDVVGADTFNKFYNTIEKRKQ